MTSSPPLNLVHSDQLKVFLTMNRMSPAVLARRGAVLCGAVGLSLTLVACGTTADTTSAAPAAQTTVAPASSRPSPSASAPADSSFAVPGYQVGEIPPVPLFTLPDLGLLTASTGRFTPNLTTSLTSRPGITVSPARCDEQGVLAGGSTVIGGDGSVAVSDASSSVVNNGDGSGSYSDASTSIINNGDGSGSYSDAAVSIVVNGDGSGSYSDAAVSVVVNGDGSGSYSDASTSIVVSGDGSGGYSDASTSIINNGDGTGTYSDAGLRITNNGDGTAHVVSVTGSITVEAAPLPKVPDVGRFPSIDAVQPVEACGTVITLSDGVLFDFGSSEVRPEAATTLTELVQVLNEAGAPQAHVYGHTDSVSDDAFNQTLSEQRAQAVVEALIGSGATASLDAQGFGETRPVAPNENPDGSDNPAGRQLNRRVEIYIPVF